MVSLPSGGAARCGLEAAAGVFPVDGAGRLCSGPEVLPAARTPPGERGLEPGLTSSCILMLSCLFRNFALIQGGGTAEEPGGGGDGKQKHPEFMVRRCYCHSYNLFMG